MVQRGPIVWEPRVATAGGYKLPRTTTWRAPEEPPGGRAKPDSLFKWLLGPAGPSGAFWALGAARAHVQVSRRKCGLRMMFFISPLLCVFVFRSHGPHRRPANGTGDTLRAALVVAGSREAR